LKQPKGYQNFSKEKAPENRDFPGLLSILEIKSALAELRRAAGGFEAVLLLPLALQTLGITAFSVSPV